MFPLIRNRSLIQVEPVAADRWRAGDVLLYRSGKFLVAHRLLRQEQRQGKPVLLTRGDAFPWWATERLRPQQVLGRVVAVAWPGGLKLRIDRGAGRLLGLLLAKLAPLLYPGYLFLSRIRQGLAGFFRPPASAEFLLPPDAPTA
jgi:hypothetical protein